MTFPQLTGHKAARICCLSGVVLYRLPVARLVFSTLASLSVARERDTPTHPDPSPLSSRHQETGEDCTASPHPPSLPPHP